MLCTSTSSFTHSLHLIYSTITFARITFYGILPNYNLYLFKVSNKCNNLSIFSSLYSNQPSIYAGNIPKANAIKCISFYYVTYRDFNVEYLTQLRTHIVNVCISINVFKWLKMCIGKSCFRAATTFNYLYCRIHHATE